MDFSKYVKLRTGIISNEQLAEWFGMKEKTIRNNKEKFLRELNGYCIYEYVDNKLNIIKILDNDNIYYYRNKVLEKALTAKFIKYWNPAGYDTTERLLEETYSASFNCTKEEALIMYNYIKCKLYGSPTMDIKGERGYCQKCLCIKKSSEKFPIPLDIIQQQIMIDIYNKYYYYDVFAQQKVDIEGQILMREGVISENDLGHFRACNLNRISKENYEKFLNEFKKVCGGELVFSDYCYNED